MTLIQFLIRMTVRNAGKIQTFLHDRQIVSLKVWQPSFQMKGLALKKLFYSVNGEDRKSVV